MTNVSKVCARCKNELPLSDFYFRNGKPHSYCKGCITLTAANHRPIAKHIPKEQSEITAIDYLKAHGIPSLPGKALNYSWVDIVAFGCVRIELKSSRLMPAKHPYFIWTISRTQIERGVLADLIMLMCRYEDKTTFHLFKPDCPAFYDNGIRKTGFTYRLGATAPMKMRKGRPIMTQSMMDEGLDRLSLIYDELHQYINQIKSSA